MISPEPMPTKCQTGNSMSSLPDFRAFAAVQGMKKDAAQPDKDSNHQDGGYQKERQGGGLAMRHRQSGGSRRRRAAVGLKHGVAYHAAHADHDQNDAKGCGAGKLEPALPDKDEGDAQPGYG